MAWTAPMTAASNATWTAAEFNAHVRDNLLETMPGKATSARRLLVSTAANAIAERVPTSDVIATAQTTTSTSYVDLTTVGPTVTVTTGVSAIAVWSAQHENSAGTAGQTWSSVDISGASSFAASDSWSLLTDGVGAGENLRLQKSQFFTGLTPGSNTFTMKYRVQGGTGTFSNRRLLVFPL